jgi:hypothetical protein
MMCCVFGGILLVVNLVVIIGIWKVFEKAGEPGWASLVPVYNLMVMARIAGQPEINGLLCFIPIVGIYFGAMLCIDLAQKFGKDAMYGIGLLLLGIIFFPMLGFGSAQYEGGRRKKRRRYDDDDDRPRRRPRDDDDDSPPRRPSPSSQGIADRPRRPRQRDDDDDDDDRPRRPRPRSEDIVDRPRRPRPRDDDEDDDDPRPRRPRRRED